MLRKIFNNREVNSLKNLSKLLDRKDIKIVCLLICLTFVAGLAEIFGVASIFYYISILTNEGLLKKVSLLIGQSVNLTIILSALGLLTLFVIKNIYLYVVNYSLLKFALSKKLAMSKKLFETYLNYSYNIFVQRKIANLQRNVIGETATVFDQVVLPFIRIFADSICGLCIVGFLLFVKPLITSLITVFLFVFLLVFYISFRSKNIELGKKRQEYASKMIESVNQGLFGFKDTKILNKENYFIERFTTSQKNTNQLSLFSLSLEQMPRLMTETLIVLIIVLIIVFVELIEGNVTEIIPLLSLFAIAGLRIMMLSNRLINQAQVIQFASPSVDTVVKEITEAEALKKENQKIDFTLEPDKAHFQLHNTLIAKNLCFQYSDQHPQVLKNLNFTINKNSSVAFVGESGVGKSTLIDIIAGLLEPTSGELLIDGTDMQEVNPQWRSLLGYIPQNVYLLNGSIAGNIAFGLEKENFDEERIWESLELAQLADYVRGLPKTIYSDIGEQGVMLSGGQRQRIGIARALYNRPEVLILDEATAALDNQTEKEFTKALEKLSGEKTLIYIAHRLTTIKNCDVIHFMEKGEIIASGTYQELLKNSKEFAKMAGD